MNRIYGITLQGTDKTDDGTGIDLAKTIPVIASLPQAPTIRLVMYPGIEPEVYLPICMALMTAKAGTQIMLQPIDSADVAVISVINYVEHLEKCDEILGYNFEMMEVANEINGDWLGKFAYKKMMVAIESAIKWPQAVTLYLDNANPDVWDWCLEHPFYADYVLMSNYQMSTIEQEPPIPLQLIISNMTLLFPNSKIGFGEYGTEAADGTNTATLEQKSQMVRQFETRPITRPNDIGGGFYWDFYADCIEKDTGLLEVFREVWK